MPEILKQVTYPNFLHDNGTPVKVERLMPEDVTIGVARGMQRLLRGAYQDQLGHNLDNNGAEHRLIHPDAIRMYVADEFNPYRVAQALRRARSHMENHGSQYWAIRDPQDPKFLLSMTKVTPRKGEVYLNDILSGADPTNEQGKGFAHATLKSALSGQDPDMPMKADVYEGSHANPYFTRLGFYRNGVEGSTRFGITRLRQVEMVADRVGLVVGRIDTPNRLDADDERLRRYADPQLLYS